MSRQREIIYRIVAESPDHLTAEEIYLKARESLPSIVLATVYNNLNALTGLRLIRRVRVFGEPDRFDGTLQPHDHLVCDRCGKLADIELGDLLDDLEGRSGVDISSYELNIHYVCDECKAKDKKRKGKGKEGEGGVAHE